MVFTFICHSCSRKVEPTDDEDVETSGASGDQATAEKSPDRQTKEGDSERKVCLGCIHPLSHHHSEFQTSVYKLRLNDTTNLSLPNF